MSEFHFNGKVTNKNKGDVHYGDVHNKESGEHVKKTRKWNIGYTIALVGVVVAILVGIITLLAWRFPIT